MLGGVTGEGEGNLSQVQRCQMSAAGPVFQGVPTGGQGRGWCRRVGGGMGHTQLKTGVQGGHMEHRGETEVKVVQKEESGGQEGKQKKPVKKQKTIWSLDLSRKSTAQPNQEDSEGLPSDHMYLRKGSI